MSVTKGMRPPRQQGMANPNPTAQPVMTNSMSGDYTPKSIYRALKADILSLTFFEIGLFGWMAIFQIAIFDWRLEVNTVTYWWMMQIGMFLGHWTAVPINWWLITKKIKEPCA